MMVARIVFATCLALAPMLVHTTERASPQGLAWQAVNDGPMGGNATRLLETRSGVLLARVNDRLYRSLDDGRSWRRCRDLPVPPTPQIPSDPPGLVWDTVAHNERLDPPTPFRPGELTLTTARCETFETAKVPGWSGQRDDALWFLSSFVGSSPSLIAVTAAGVMRSTDGGKIWQQAAQFDSRQRTCAANRFRELLIVSGTTLYESKDNGATWPRVPEDPDAGRNGVAAPGRSPRLGCPFIQANNHSYLYSAGPDGVWRSYPYDTPEWTRVHSGRPDLIAATEQRVWMVLQTPQGKMLMRSDNTGTSWTAIPFPLAQENRIYELLDTQRGTLLAASSAGIYRSADNGRSWTLTGVTPEKVTLAASLRHAYASDSSGLWISRDGGASWQKAQPTVDGRPWSSMDQLMRVFDVGGRTAAVINDRLYNVSGDGVGFTRAGLDQYVESIVRVNGTYYAGASEGVFRSRDFATWNECSLGLNSGGPLFAVGRGDLLVGAESLSTDGCRFWWPFETRNAPPLGEFMFARSRDVVSFGKGIQRLDLDTRAWTVVKDDTEIVVTSAVADTRGRYWLGSDHGVYALMPDDYGWELFPMGLQHDRITALMADSHGVIIAAVRGKGLYRAVSH